MKHFYMTLCLLAYAVFGTFQLNAQNGEYEFKGRVMNAEHQAIPLATVLIKQDTTQQVLHGVAASVEGFFSVKLSSPGDYFVEIRSIGYKSLTQKVRIDEVVTEHDFILQENAIELSETVIVAKFSKLEPNGNTKVKFKGNPIIKGKSMAQVLRYVQGLEVHGNSLLINGKTKNLIYLGNRLITPQQLYAIPPTMIESIELIPNPGVSYGKEANEGGVLVVTLRKEEGVIGTATLPIQLDVNGLVDIVPSVSLQYQRGKFTLYNTLLGGHGRYRIEYEHKDAYEGLAELIKSSTKIRTKENLITDDIGAQYRINDHHLVNVFGGVSYDKYNRMHTSARENAGRSLEQEQDLSSLNLSGGIGYLGKFNVAQGATLSGTVSYSDSQSNTKNRYNYDSESQADMEGRLFYLAFNPKASIKLKGNQSISTGVIYNYGEDKNKTDGIQSQALSQLIKREYRIRGFDFAPYAEYSKYFERLFLQVGLRYQTTKVMYEDLLNANQDYNVTHRGIYPNVMMQYLISREKSRALQFAYRHFFSLPNYGYYSPFATYSRENFYSIGNQRLKQEVFDEAELDYYFNQDLNFTYRIQHGRNLIQLMTYEDKRGPNLFFTQPENVGTRWQHYLAGAYKKWLLPFRRQQ